MSNFYFFTEESKLKAQTEEYSYGPVKDFEDDKYKVTSQFESTSASKAIAVTSGIIIIQPQTNTSLVNLLLFPTEPSLSQFTPVQYYIYRGLNRENFLNTSNKLVAHNDLNFSTDLTNQVWVDIKKRYPNATEANLKSIGWDLITDNDNKNISEILNEKDNDYTRTTVKAGAYIGNFAGGSLHPIGFEIVLMDKFYNYNLGNLRAEKLIIEPTYQIQSSDIEGRLTIQQMAEREQILNFVDPAAYYNTYYGIGVYEEGNTTPFLKDQIYSNLLSKFKTCKTVYIDIRNENGYSLNYYRDDHYNVIDKTNIKLKVNQTLIGNRNYYKNFWPIYTVEYINISTSLYDITLSVFDKFETKPFIYYDCAFVKKIVNTVENLVEKNITKFLLFPNVSLNWIDIINGFSMPSFGGNSVVWINKIYVGKRDYSNLPNSYPKKVHYLDYLFGPIDAISTIAPASGTKWNTILGKKLVYIPHHNTYNAVEVIISETNSIIDLTLNTVDIFEYNKTGVKSGCHYKEPISIKGVSKKSEFPYNPDFNETDLRSVFNNIENTTSVTMIISNLDDFPRKQTLNKLTIGRSEFDTYIKPAINTIEQSVHDASLCVIGIDSTGPTTNSLLDKKKDTNDNVYHKGIIQIKGFATNGVPAINLPLQGIDILTTDGMFFNSLTVSNSSKILDATDKMAYIGTDKIVELIEDIESVYFKKPNANPKYIIDDIDHNVLQSFARLRVHSYGSQFTSKYGLGEVIISRMAFESLSPDSPDQVITDLTITAILSDRMLFGLDYHGKYEQQYKAFTAHADEVCFQDNPSPYLQHPDSNNPQYSIDFGQILYGFESLVWPRMNGDKKKRGYYGYNFYKLYNDFTIYSDISNKLIIDSDSDPFKISSSSSSKFPIELESVDYSGLIANIATPVAEYLYHLKEGKAPDKTVKFGMPLIADLNSYYTISAPNADLYGNADAIGIFNAYSMLKHNQELKMSDVFDLYYNGALRTGVTPLIDTHSPDYKYYYEAGDRWKIMGLYYGILDYDGANLKWMPNSPNGTTWKDIRGNLLCKMWMFAEFWYNKLYHNFRTGLRLLDSSETDIHRFIYNSNWEEDVNSDFELDPSDLLVIRSSILYCFNDKFIPFLKSKIESEEGITL